MYYLSISLPKLASLIPALPVISNYLKIHQNIFFVVHNSCIFIFIDEKVTGISRTEMHKEFFNFKLT